MHVKGFSFDFRTFTPQITNQHGIYSDDFVTFGTFIKEAGNPLENEEVLLKLVDEHNEHDDNIVDKTTFRFEANQLSFTREVNPEISDVEINLEIVQSPLDNVNKDSWTEALFYGLGNKTV